MPQAKALDLARWSHSLRDLERDLDAYCRHHPAGCPCHLCQVAGLVGDALWHLDRLGQPPPAAARTYHRRNR
jgi:hypothetical protein